MKLKWEYVKPLKDKNIFREVEQKYNLKVPSELKELIL